MWYHAPSWCSCHLWPIRVGLQRRSRGLGCGRHRVGCLASGVGGIERRDKGMAERSFERAVRRGYSELSWGNRGRVLFRNQNSLRWQSYDLLTVGGKTLMVRNRLIHNIVAGSLEGWTLKQQKIRSLLCNR